MRITKLNDLIKDSETVKGRWKLNDRHELIYRAAGEDEAITVSKKLVAAEAGSLVCSVTERKKNGTATGLLRLAGKWRVDSQNRIVFDIKKGHGKKDSLVFQGAWELGPAHEIIYSWKREIPKTPQGGIERIQRLVFKGYWDISAGNRLTYYVGGSTDSALKFRGTFQTKTIAAKKGEIRYQIGLELNGKPGLKTITLFGKWKYSNKFGLSFEVAYGGKRYPAIRFGGNFKAVSRTEIEVSLKARHGKPLGIELKVSRPISGKDGQLFARVLKSLEKSEIEAGAKLIW